MGLGSGVEKRFFCLSDGNFCELPVYATTNFPTKWKQNYAMSWAPGNVNNLILLL